MERLIELACKYEKSFTAYEEGAIILTPYATAYRYPGESATLEPSREEFDEAFRLADGIVTFVYSLVPSELKPGKQKS